jgi:hypothetical protein
MKSSKYITDSKELKANKKKLSNLDNFRGK